MRGLGFLRFNEQKKAQSTNPLTLALSPGGERGRSQGFNRKLSIIKPGRLNRPSPPRGRRWPEAG